MPALVDGQAAVPIPFLSKRIKINGVPRRALDLIGQINVVMFTPQDLELVTGSPSVRRRHLDAMNCQVDPATAGPSASTTGCCPSGTTC